jgi:asparagine synthetase B (glutamine-hydrolysing)
MVPGLRDRLLQAVQVRLHADVLIGIYLSGGIDSAIIAGMAAHLIKQKVRPRLAVIRNPSPASVLVSREEMSSTKRVSITSPS